MKILLLTIGKTTTGYLKEGIDLFIKRIGHYVPFEFKTLLDIKAVKGMDINNQKKMEGQLFLSAVQQSDVVVLLDERGNELTSREFADYINKKMLAGTRRLVFMIGGPYGFSPEVYDRANELLSLSKMTFSHEMVRLFFVEQIYRAMTIIKGEPYHHD